MTKADDKEFFFFQIEVKKRRYFSALEMKLYQTV